MFWMSLFQKESAESLDYASKLAQEFPGFWHFKLFGKWFIQRMPQHFRNQTSLSRGYRAICWRIQQVHRRHTKSLTFSIDTQAFYHRKHSLFRRQVKCHKDNWQRWVHIYGYLLESQSIVECRKVFQELADTSCCLPILAGKCRVKVKIFTSLLWIEYPWCFDKLPSRIMKERFGPARTTCAVNNVRIYRVFNRKRLWSFHKVFQSFWRKNGKCQSCTGRQVFPLYFWPSEYWNFILEHSEEDTLISF